MHLSVAIALGEMLCRRNVDETGFKSKNAWRAAARKDHLQPADCSDRKASIPPQPPSSRPRLPSAWARSTGAFRPRSEEHTSELQSLMRISYAVFCLKKKTKNDNESQQTITSV